MPHVSDNALVLFPGALGDFICCLPALCALRARHQGRMLVVGKLEALSLLKLAETQTTSIDRREVADLFAIGTPPAATTLALFSGFDSVYSWTGFGNAEFVRRLRAVTRGDVRVFAFRGMRPGEHAADYYARCVGCTAVMPAPGVIAADTDWWADVRRHRGLTEQPFAVVHPGSGSRRKNWEGFNELIRRWSEWSRDPIVVLRGPAEPEIELSNGIALGGLSLPQVSAVLRACSFYIGNDSGISHLAGVVGTHGLALFGSSNPDTWAPRGPGIRVLQGVRACADCGPERFCVHRLPVETVMRACVHRQTSFSKAAAACPVVPDGGTPRR